MKRHLPGTYFIMEKNAVETIARHPRTKILLPVYVSLCFHANGKRGCFPAYERLMALSGYRARATIARALKILEEMGVLSRSVSPGRSNFYTLHELATTSSPHERVSQSSSRREQGVFTAKGEGVHGVNVGCSPAEREEESLKRNH